MCLACWDAPAPASTVRRATRQLVVTQLTPPAARRFTTCSVVASEKGVVVGRLTFREDGDLIDCSKARSRSSVCFVACSPN